MHQFDPRFHSFTSCTLIFLTLEFENVFPKLEPVELEMCMENGMELYGFTEFIKFATPLLSTRDTPYFTIQNKWSKLDKFKSRTTFI